VPGNRDVTYKIVRHDDGWGVLHEGSVWGNYLTKEAAFEAAVAEASNAIKQGYWISIKIAVSEKHEPALGTSN
jgi:hypothetical protein